LRGRFWGGILAIVDHHQGREGRENGKGRERERE